MKEMHKFGKYNEWGIDTDDGCLRFYPNLHQDDPKPGRWIWREAIQEVENLGGYDEAVKYLRGLTQHVKGASIGGAATATYTAGGTPTQ